MGREPSYQPISREPGVTNTSSRVASESATRVVSGTGPIRVPSVSQNRRVLGTPIMATQVFYVDRYVYLDGSMTTATVFEMNFAYGDVSTVPIFSLGENAVIAEVNIWMLETFDGVGPVVTIGKAGSQGDLMDTTELDPSILSSFSTRPGKEYLSGDVVNLYINPGAGASKGRGVISIYII